MLNITKPKLLICSLILSVFILAAGNSKASDDYLPNPDIDVLHYRFELALSDQSNLISGKTSIAILLKKEGISQFTLDLINKKSDGNGMTVSAVMLDDIPLTFSHINDQISITLPEISRVNQKLTIVVSYSGVPADGLVISKNKFGERTFFGDNWPNRARNWLPTVDHPSDKATLEFIVTAPDHYQVIANGLQIEESNLENDAKKTHWKQSVPIPTKLMVIGVSRFAVEVVDTYKNIEIQSWVYPQDREKGFFDFARSRRILEFFDQRIGPFAYEKLANVQSKTRYGGMENATAIFYNENAITGQRRNENTVVHEIAHQWFGDSVTEKDWHHVWLSEGFATYFTIVFNEFTYGRDRAVQALERNRTRIINYYTQNPDSPVVDEKIKDLNNLLSTNSYQKGGWVLHMLRWVVGEESFWQGIRQYYSEYRDSNALTGDLRRVMEEASGTDLSTFFDQWIFTPGQPKYEGEWQYDKGSKKLRISLRQTQDSGILFDMPVEFGIYFEGNGQPIYKKFRINKARYNLSFDIDGEPKNVVLDPNTWLLMESDFKKK